MKHTILLFYLITSSLLFSQNKKQSIGFIENKGQIIDQKGKSNAEVKYLLNSNGLNVQLKKNGFSYDVYEVKNSPVTPPREERNLPSLPNKNIINIPSDSNLQYTFHRIDVDFVNSNSKVELIAEQKSNDFDNYYNLPNKTDGVIGVYHYKQITYKSIYPNIDIVFMIPNDPQKVVEYNFVIHPKGKIADIQLKFSGVETDLVDDKIQMDVRFGKMEETLPASWIEETNQQTAIAVNYRKIKKNVYGFKSSCTVSNKTLIIDPVPVRIWGTYYGGEEFDYATSIFIKDDFVYMAGITYSTNNIASAGSHQSIFTPNNVVDSFFTKLNSDGTRVWGSYYGGISRDEIWQIKVSNRNNIYIAGRTISPTNISTPSSHQPIKSGYYDGFIAKFDTNGSRLWATYYGGLDNEEVNSIIIDPNENIYASGATFSKEGIASTAAYQTNSINPSNTQDAFIVKFNENGIRQWGTYYGGNNSDQIYDSKFDSSGDIVFLGNTRSSNNISTANSYRETNVNNDGFLLKFSPNRSRIWSTYIGGNNDDFFFNLGIDSADNLYCFGYTYSTSDVSTPGTFQQDFIADDLGRSGNVLKFSANGFKIWGSYFFPETLGGSVTKNGSIYFTGRVLNGFLPTPNAFQEIRNTGTDSYLVKYNTNGQREWATYFGGEGADNAIITETDNNSYIYLAGTSSSKTNIATTNTHQPNLYPNPNNYTPNVGDAFIVKFKDCFAPTSASSNSPICIGSTLELKAAGGTNYHWTGPNGFTSTDQNPSIANATANYSGEYHCLVSGIDSCDDTKSINVVVGDIVAPLPDITNLPSITGDCHTTINTIPTATDNCTGIITGTTANPITYNLPGTYTIVWNYSDGNGNSSSQNQTVIITSQPLPSANRLQTFCNIQNATLDNIEITGQNIKWYNTATAGTLLTNTTLLQNDITYYASQTINACESDRVPVTVKIQSPLPPTGDTDQPFCTGQNPTLENIQVNGNLIKWYDASTNGTLLPSSTHLEDGKTYYASQTVNACESQRLAVIVSVGDTPPPPLELNNRVFCKNENATLNNIPVSGQNLKWYSSIIAAGVIPNSTLLENNTTYYVSQTTGCESDRTPILVKVNDTALPISKAEQIFCLDDNPTIANLNITGTDISWYNVATGGTTLTDATVLHNGTYYATQTLNNCESERHPIVVKIQDTKIPQADSPQTFCIQKNATINDLTISGEKIKWYESSSSQSSLSESTPLENGITYYASQTINSCESDRTPVTINILGATTGDCINLVDELPFPKFFTPNNDTYNDTWSIDFNYLTPNSSIKIFDRYGKLIKELFRNDTWNGNYLDQELPASDYWFVATRSNGVEYRGHFSLKR